MVTAIFLKKALQEGWIRPLDYYFARSLDPALGALGFAAALTSVAAAAGHAAMPLQALLHPALLFGAGADRLKLRSFYDARPFKTQAAVRDFFKKIDQKSLMPLVLTPHALYLHRFWVSDQRLIRFFYHENRPLPTALRATTELTQRLTVIAGGPGTGKSSRIAQLVQQKAPQAIIALSAPTGKAVARLKTLLPHAWALTLHRLLGLSRRSDAPRYHPRNPLPVDLLIIDEASMVDLPLMQHAVNALPPQAQLLLVGDPHQLNPVGVGSPFADLCQAARGTRKPLLLNTVLNLHHTYRFNPDSGVAAVARAVAEGSGAALMQHLEAPWPDFLWVQPSPPALTTLLLDGYAEYFELVRTKAPLAQLWAAFERFRCLCAQHGGPEGTERLNQICAQALDPGAIPGALAPGMALLITENIPSLNLSNGDVGLLWPSSQGPLQLHFPDGQGGFNAVYPQLVSNPQLGFAISVHKAQGSEFDEVCVVIPSAGAWLTAEWLTTALTRAKKRATLYGGDARFLAALVQRRVRCYGGLGVV